jgi:NADPH:quinone reductase-like Zn-dependent oxidoreductase
MKEIRLRKPAGLDQLETRNMESGPVTRGEIRVRLHASSLNVHDSFVLKGVIPTEAGRIPIAVSRFALPWRRADSPGSAERKSS